MKTRALLSILNSNNGDQKQKDDSKLLLDAVRELVAKYYPLNPEFDKKLEALFMKRTISMIHQVLRNSCVPLGYSLVFFCANKIPDPPIPTNSPVCFESSLY